MEEADGRSKATASKMEQMRRAHNASMREALVAQQAKHDTALAEKEATLASERSRLEEASLFGSGGYEPCKAQI